ncbi:uncharacterized protein ATNIH1004_004353 [Aspergillus tanneri]|uniref:Rhodopsin domain-containing protein n=1 Tax=Aspergillus tanneri TaxID=1220188 RepID=A0A5M9MNB1_9EURO|nr:uncharacterized protein ATNIH1004_004353 [Aspergillus tanneri]KAA8648468.1 hypothetical protein ATNIH1004_004353 [Aspergillus tanneri]
MSLAFCVGNTIAISIATANGYGDRTDTVLRTQRDAVMKSQYAATLLFILSISFSKLSMTCFIQSLSPAARDRILAHVVQGLVVVTGLIAFFGSAFRCHFPRTWDYMCKECVSETVWTIFIAVTNMISDALIITQSILLVVNIQAAFKKKALFASIFLPRIFVITATLCQLILALKTHPVTDPFTETSTTTICMEVTQSLSIITACWAQLKPFLERIRFNAFSLQGTEYSKTVSSKASRTELSQLRSKESYLMSVQGFVSSSIQNSKTIALAAKMPEWDSGSQSNEARIIRQTRMFSVTEVHSDSST